MMTFPKSLGWVTTGAGRCDRSTPPKLLRGGWPAFLTAPRVPQSSWAVGAPFPCFKRSPWAASQRDLPVALVLRGIASDPRSVPWALHASGGQVLLPPRLSSFAH